MIEKARLNKQYATVCRQSHRAHPPGSSAQLHHMSLGQTKVRQIKYSEMDMRTLTITQRLCIIKNSILHNLVFTGGVKQDVVFLI